MNKSWRLASLSLFLLGLTACAQAQSRQIQRATVNGVELAYEVQGDGEPVLLIHGAALADSFYPLMAEPVLANYRLINYHRRGYGASGEYEGCMTHRQQADDALALLDHLGIRKVHIVGHSAGGNIGMALASQAPDRVASLGLLEPGLRVRDANAPEPRSGPCTVEQASEQAIERTALLMSNAFGPDWRQQLPPVLPSAVDQVMDDAVMFGSQEWPGLLIHDGYADPEFFSRISSPTVRVFSEQRFVGMSEAQFGRLQAWWILVPHAEFRLLPGMGHEMQVFHPQPVAELIADWLVRNPIQ